METMKRVAESPHHLVMLSKVREGADTEALTAEDFSEIGCVVRVHQAAHNESKLQFVAEGVGRAAIAHWLNAEPPFVAQLTHLGDDTDDSDRETKAYAMAVMAIIKELIPLNPLYSEELKQFLNRFSPNHSGLLADFAANLTTANGAELQTILEMLSTRDRLERVLELLRHELEVARLQQEIRQEVEQKIGDQQRRFFLQEQLKTIQAELGISKDDRTADVELFRGRIEGREIPDAVSERIEEELDKLGVLERGSPEYGVTRNYLDWMTNVPWGIQSDDVLDLDRARGVLDDEHTGLQDVKDRIIEFLAVGKLRGGVGGSIILLVGPPGVGKTSIGRSVANALGREFYRFSVGGMRDEAEIKGHRRTYIGAMPGKLVQALKDVGTENPVLMLDEIDKIGSSYHGDPASALLEVLDPEQNTEFLDHYLDLRLDLSKALFICTANQLDTIPRPLLDRMEIIRLAGYITQEKVGIAQATTSWPRQLERAGLKPSQLKVSDAAADAGRRRLCPRGGRARAREAARARITRKAAVRIVEGKTKRISVGPRNLEEFLGPPVFKAEKPRRAIGAS